MKGAGTGFLGITNKRIIYYDKAFLKNKKALVSIPYDRIASVASEDNKGFLIQKGFFVILNASAPLKRFLKEDLKKF